MYIRANLMDVMNSVPIFRFFLPSIETEVFSGHKAGQHLEGESEGKGWWFTDRVGAWASLLERVEDVVFIARF